ncbi:hypothetical protein J4Q44_G00018060 [Coregonus suidteri]|uniref:Uncharacterized protein n=1 Tax=Coregonus suidteri TaxID=861788 RepID=A0AAN8NF37_9TELE
MTGDKSIFENEVYRFPKEASQRAALPAWKVTLAAGGGGSRMMCSTRIGWAWQGLAPQWVGLCPPRPTHAYAPDANSR